MSVEAIPEEQAQPSALLSGALVSCWARRLTAPSGGVCLQAFLRIRSTTIAVGWVTRYVDIPQRVMWTNKRGADSRAIELHLWRVRIGMRLAANPADEPRAAKTTDTKSP